MKSSSDTFFFFLSTENLVGKPCAIVSIFLGKYCHLTRVGLVGEGWQREEEPFPDVPLLPFSTCCILLFHLSSPSVENCIMDATPSLAFSRQAIKEQRLAVETPVRLQCPSRTHSLSPSVITHVAFSPSSCHCFKNWF